MTGLKEAMLRAALARVLKEEIDKADKAGRADTLARLITARDAVGLKSADVELPDGTVIAKATLPTPQPGLHIDEAAFMRFVRAEHPAEIVEAVRESFRRAVMKDLKIVGDQVINVRTGEAVPWASVGTASAQPTHFTITFVPGGREAVRQAWKQQRLDLLEHLAPPELTAGGDGDV